MDEIQHIRRLAKEKSDLLYWRRVEGWDKAKYLLAKHTRPARKWGTCILKIVKATWKYGRVVKNKTGVRFSTQIVHQAMSALKHDVHPDGYYRYSIYGDFDRASQYISKNMWGEMLEVLLANQGTTEGGMLSDKRASGHHFREHDLPTIPVLAEFEDGNIIPRDWNGHSSLPAVDLFSKPVDARQGKGARRWLIQPDGRYQTEEGDCVGQGELLQRLKKQSKKRVILLQRRVANHPRIHELTGPTLASVRIITMRKPGSKAEYLAGLISLPLGSVTGSNARFGTIWVPIDADTGRLGAGYDPDPACVMEPIAEHPITGHSIEGFQLPDWEEAVDLARRAHDTFDSIALIGWDIGLAPEGPVIIEGNRTPGGESLQVAHKRPWGATRFPELYRANFQHAVTYGDG